MTDELAKALAFGFFSFCGNDPPGAHPLVPRSLRKEEFPCGFVGAKLLLLSASELGAFSLFVSVDAGFFLATRREGLEAGGMHETFF